MVTINLPAGTTEYDITLRLRAYNPDAEIQIFKAGDSTNYFEGKMSGQSSSRITVGAGTRLTIRVSEPNTDYTLTFARSRWTITRYSRPNQSIFRRPSAVANHSPPQEGNCRVQARRVRANI